MNYPKVSLLNWKKWKSESICGSNKFGDAKNNVLINSTSGPITCIYSESVKICDSNISQLSVGFAGNIIAGGVFLYMLIIL